MRAIIVWVAGLMLLLAAEMAAAAPPAGPAQKPAPPAHPATHHKASSFAPHPTKRRTFGAPIQAPIMKHVAPKKKPTPPK